MTQVFQNLSVYLQYDVTEGNFSYATVFFSPGGSYMSTALELPQGHELTFCGQTMNLLEGSGQYYVDLNDVNGDGPCSFSWQTDSGDVYETLCKFGVITVTGGVPTQFSKAASHTLAVSAGTIWAGQTMNISLRQDGSQSGTQLNSSVESATIGNDGKAILTLTTADMSPLPTGPYILFVSANERGSQVTGPGGGQLLDSVVRQFAVSVVD